MEIGGIDIIAGLSGWLQLLIAVYVVSTAALVGIMWTGMRRTGSDN